MVPANILWKHKNGYIFVIDGSHRLSALGAWINDDYGDNDISLNYYEKFIPQEQKEIAEYTRKLVNEKIGSFKDYQRARRNSEGIPQYILDNVKNLGNKIIAFLKTNYIVCQQCGKLVKIKSKNDHSTKYCKDCADRIESESSILRKRKQREREKCHESEFSSNPYKH